MESARSSDEQCVLLQRKENMRSNLKNVISSSATEKNVHINYDKLHRSSAKKYNELVLWQKNEERNVCRAEFILTWQKRTCERAEKKMKLQALKWLRENRQNVLAYKKNTVAGMKWLQLIPSDETKARSETNRWKLFVFNRFTFDPIYS